MSNSDKTGPVLSTSCIKRGVDRSAIGKHIRNAHKMGELDREATRSRIAY